MQVDAISTGSLGLDLALGVGGLLGLRLGLLGGRGNVVVLIFCHSVMLLCHLFPARCGQTQARAFQFFRY